MERPNNRVINGPREKWGYKQMGYPYANISSLRISKRRATRSERVERDNVIETEPDSRIPFSSPGRYEVPTAGGARDGAESGKDRGSQVY